MATRPFARSARVARIAFVSVLLLVAQASITRAAPTLGFEENWPGTTLSTWAGQSTLSNPGTGGFGGDGDGFLLVSTSTATNLGTRSMGPEYTGNWTAGITQVRVWLNDVNASQPLEIHFGIGRDVFQVSPNIWQYNVGLIPPFHAWGEYLVDLTSPDWTQIHGTGTFADALQNVQTVHLRHDVAPFVGNPDPIAGDFGVDHLLLTNGVVGVEPGPRRPVAQPVQLAAPVPNPSRAAVALSLESFDGGAIHVQIVDATGRLVRHAELAAGGAGPRVWMWDGADDAGTRVRPGYYRARAWSASGGTSRAIVRVD